MRNIHRRYVRRSRAQSAFTLIEMLVVILIISILAAMIIPKLFGHTDDAKIAKAKADISQLESALQDYRLSNGTFPSTEDGLAALTTQPSDASDWKGPYIEHNVPNDPWDHPYVYQSPGPNGQDYVIISYGSDGQPGGTGAAADISSDDN